MDNLDEVIPAGGFILQILEGRSEWAQNYRKRAEIAIAWDVGSQALLTRWPTDDEEGLMIALSKLRAGLGA